MGGANFYSEVQAYCQLSGAEINDAELWLLRQLYRVHMSSLDKKGKPPERSVTVEASDGAEVAGLLRGMGARKAKQK